jgi:hypothetical protein
MSPRRPHERNGGTVAYPASLALRRRDLAVCLAVARAYRRAMPLDEGARFPIRFDAGYRVISTALFLAPSRSFVEVEGDEVRVRMAWAFRARFPRSAVASASDFREKPLSRGVHGFAGRWLVNGSGQGIVSIDLEPGLRGYVMGFPVRLRRLLVSVEDPEGLMRALQG